MTFYNLFVLSQVSKILNIDWLEQSSREQQFLDTEDFLHVHDAEAEKRYNFSMVQTIQNGIDARRERGGVLGGRWIYICQGVAGNQAPSAKELRLIVEAAGGILLSSLDSQDFDPNKTIILTSDPRTQSQLNESGVKEQVDNGAKTCTTSWLFHTIITQTLVGFDLDQSPKRRRGRPPIVKSPQVSDLVRCNSPASIMSTLTATPVKRLNRKRNANTVCDGSVCSAASKGSKISDLEYVKHASSPKKRMQKEVQANELAAQPCTNLTSRDKFLSDFSPTTEPFTKDTAIIKLHTLWLNYFQQSRSVSTTPKLPRTGKGVRCRRGRKKALSPLVSCTTSAEVAPIPMNTPSLQKKRRGKNANAPYSSKVLPEHHGHISWEAYVLFTLELRAKELDGDRRSISDTNQTAGSYFPKPTSIEHSEKTLSLTVNSVDSIGRNQESTRQIFGTLQDLFDLHRQHQFGPIPESAMGRLAVLATQAVCATHACGVIHNDITLDSFLISRAASNGGESEDEWHLQLIGFGYKSVVLNCQEDSDGVRLSCNAGHFEHDYKCLANVVHLLLTGGMPIALKTEFGRLEFASKEFLKGNLFLRGALSWCALIDALMCTGDDFDPTPIRLEHPLDIFGVEESASYPKCRKSQISWACRMLFEISTTNKSLSSFLKELCSYNERFSLPNGLSREYSYSATSERLSFIICQPVDSSRTMKSDTENTGSSRLQNQLRARECAVAHREAMFHKELSLVEEKLQESKILHQSNIVTEQSLQKREAGLLRKEKDIESELNHIQKMKEDLLAREQMLELRIQRMSSKHDSASDQESHEGYNSSPGHSIQGRSSVCSSVDRGRNKRRKKTKDFTSQNHPRPSVEMAESPSDSTSFHLQSSVPRPSEHLCSLQNLIGSPTIKNMRGTNTPGKPRRAPKKVFIDMNMDD